jgi:hypothetical protein
MLVPLLAVSLAGVAAFAPAAAAQSKSDKAILKAGVVTKGDVPPDWTSKKGSSSDQAYKGIAECEEIKTALDNAKKKTPRAQSREYEEPGTRGTTSAENTVYAFKNTSAAEKFLSGYQASDASTCFQKGTEKVAKSQSGAGVPSVSPVTDLEGVGDGAVGYEITIPISLAGRSATVYLDLIAVRVGRAFVGFNFSNLDGPIPDGPAIVQAVVARVAEAQGSA